MADRSTSFTLPGGGTTSNEIAVGNDGLYALQIPDSGMEGTNLAVYTRARVDTPLKALYLWDGTARTQVKLTTVAAGDLLWFETPISGVYSIALVADSQTGDSVITARWGRVLV